MCPGVDKDYYTGENFTRLGEPCNIYQCKLVSNNWYLLVIIGAEGQKVGHMVMRPWNVLFMLGGN